MGPSSKRPVKSGFSGARDSSGAAISVWGRTVTPRGIPSTTVSAIPSMSAPGTFFIIRTAVRKMPSSARRGSGAARVPISTRFSSAVIRPALMSPERVRKSPTPADSANLKGMGRASFSRTRRGLRARNRTPESSTRASACCQVQPYFWHRVWVNRVVKPRPGARAKGRLDTSPDRILPAAAIRQVAVMTCPKSISSLSTS